MCVCVCVCVCIHARAQLLNRVQLFATLWTVTCQAFCLWEFPGKNTWVSCHFLLQGISLTQGSNQHLLHWQADSLPLILYHWILNPLQRGTEVDKQMILSQSLRCMIQGRRLWNSPETAITLRGNQVNYASLYWLCLLPQITPFIPSLPLFESTSQIN